MDEPVWAPGRVHRERLMEGDIAGKCSDRAPDQARGELLSDEHFSVDGPLIEAWASQQSFQRKDGTDQTPKVDPARRS